MIKTNQISLPFHIRIAHWGERIWANDYKVIDITFCRNSTLVSRKWEIDLILFNRYFEINKEK